MRLGKVSRLDNAGHVVGCVFYPLAHPTAECPTACFAGEHLPPPSQPAIEITLAKYANATDAHNAFVRTAERGSDIQRFGLPAGTVGLCYQTDFWEPDHGQDVACTFSKGSTAVVIRTVVNHSELNVESLAQAIYPAIAS